MLRIIRLASRSELAFSRPEHDPDVDRVKELIESGPGTYVLILHVGRAKALAIGALGKLKLVPGYYGYVGSAFGPGGLRARLTHHLKGTSRPHWHIDYLRRQVKIAEIWFSSATARQEHAWARAFQATPGVVIAAPRFGASDCQCASHLFSFAEPVLTTLRDCLDSIGAPLSRLDRGFDVAVASASRPKIVERAQPEDTGSPE